MSFVYVALVFIGVLAGVRVMLYGVERKRPTEATPRSFSVTPALVTVFCLTAGIAGYILLRLGTTSAVTAIAAAAVGLLSSALSAAAVNRWWLVVPEHDVDDERYVLQGSLAQVVSDIAERGVGQVTLRSDSNQQPMPARGVDDQAVRTGTEVVIERIENGVAFVEEWESVEKRL
jgi:membrane protein implicated in regulation of membrane protease activity